jgi:hypothetical protein
MQHLCQRGGHSNWPPGPKEGCAAGQGPRTPPHKHCWLSAEGTRAKQGTGSQREPSHECPPCPLLTWLTPCPLRAGTEGGLSSEEPMAMWRSLPCASSASVCTFCTRLTLRQKQNIPAFLPNKIWLSFLQRRCGGHLSPK